MGTSSSFGGSSGATPLIPSWLDPGGTNGGGSAGAAPSVPVPAAGDASRFAPARSNFSRFARSGGRDRASLGRAVSHYVRTSSGGASSATARMGSSRAAGGRLLNFLNAAAARGGTAALRELNLGGLAGRPIEEVFVGLAEYVCPEGGSLDEGIAREAFVETIVDLAAEGVTDLNTLTADQISTVFELYATHAIEARLCNDIGTKAITLPGSARQVGQVQGQLHDFIRRGVADALSSARTALTTLTPDRVLSFVDGVYTQAFDILQAMGDRAAEGGT